jgi:uncharacterized membrane protein YbjE (DUF340 family)
VAERERRIRILRGMQHSTRIELGRVPARRRQQLAVLLSPVAAVLLIAGVLLGWRAGSPAGHLAGAVLTLLALMLLGIGYGLLRSVRIQARERRLDEAILATAGVCGTAADGTVGSVVNAAPACRQVCGTDACAAVDCAVRALPR